MEKEFFKYKPEYEASNDDRDNIELQEQEISEQEKEQMRIFSRAKETLLEFGKKASELIPSKENLFRAATAAVIVSTIGLKEGTFYVSEQRREPADSEYALSPKELEERRAAYDALEENADIMTQEDLREAKEYFEELSGDVLVDPDELPEVTVDKEVFPPKRRVVEENKTQQLIDKAVSVTAKPDKIDKDGEAVNEAGRVEIETFNHGVFPPYIREKESVAEVAEAGSPKAGTSKQEKKVEIEAFEPSLTVLDARFSSQEEVEDYLQEKLGDNYVSRVRLIDEFGEDFNERWSEVLKKYPMALVHVEMDKYAYHGQNVIQVAEETWDRAKEFSGLENMRELEAVPLQDALSFTEAEDTLGNKGVGIYFDEQKIIGLLKDNPDRIANISAPVGHSQVFAMERYRVIPEVDLDLKPEYFRENGDYMDIPDYLNGKGIMRVLAHDPYFGVNSKENFPPTHGFETGGPPAEGGPGPTTVYFDEESRFIGYRDGKTGEYVLAEDAPVITREELRERWEAATAEAEKKAQVVEAKVPYVRIAGAYEKEKAESNLRRLFEVANAYPEKLFVVAGGNEGEDIREAMETLAEERPSNLVIVAQWGAKRPTHGMHGADIYVDNSDLKIPDGSSFSTPAVSAYAAMLAERGMSNEQIIESIKSSGDEAGYVAGYRKENVRIFTEVIAK